MAKVVTVSEKRTESGARRCAEGASRYGVFSVLCAAVDALYALPDDESEQYAEIIGRAIELGWSPQ
jgi:hypothetical protein